MNETKTNRDLKTDGRKEVKNHHHYYLLNRLKNSSYELFVSNTVDLLVVKQIFVSCLTYKVWKRKIILTGHLPKKANLIFENNQSKNVHNIV